MSITPACWITALNSSGRWFATAPTSSPPLDTPWMASFDGRVYPLLMRYSAAPMKSSNTFCLCSFVPASCHFSPYSLPPRMFADAYTTPCSSSARRSALNAGKVPMLNPPYP